MISTQKFPYQGDKAMIVSKELPLSALKGPAKEAGITLNDWLLGCAFQAVGLLDEKEKGEYLHFEIPFAVHKGTEITEYPPKLWNGICMPAFQV